jgi:hypothetical protein
MKKTKLHLLLFIMLLGMVSCFTDDEAKDEKESIPYGITFSVDKDGGEAVAGESVDEVSFSDTYATDENDTLGDGSLKAYAQLYPGDPHQMNLMGGSSEDSNSTFEVTFEMVTVTIGEYTITDLFLAHPDTAFQYALTSGTVKITKVGDVGGYVEGTIDATITASNGTSNASVTAKFKLKRAGDVL